MATQPKKAELLYSEKKDLYKTEGSRPLTKAEQKAKDQFEATREPFVTRLTPPQCASRIPLADLLVGLKIRGRIISVKEYGMFVDVGSQKDGLVHVKDISKDYFIQNHASKFVPGQDVDVWVKFCDHEEMKLGLQMFPVSSSSSTSSSSTSSRSRAGMAAPQATIRRQAATEALQSLSAGQTVHGTVMRASNYGVYVDIGVGIDAYLHKRKMKVGRKMMKLMPWEISPVGSHVQGWVYEASQTRGRISITTYNPSTWEEMLPAKRLVNCEDPLDEAGGFAEEDGGDDRDDADTDGDDFDDDDEDEDDRLEWGDGQVDVRRRNAVARTLALSLDDEDDEGYDARDGRSIQLSVSDMSPSELRAIEQKRAGRSDAAAQSVMDDLGRTKLGKPDWASVAKGMEQIDASLLGEEISTFELFSQISYNRPTISFKDIKQVSSWNTSKQFCAPPLNSLFRGLKFTVGLHERPVADGSYYRKTNQGTHWDSRRRQSDQ